MKNVILSLLQSIYELLCEGLPPALLFIVMLFGIFTFLIIELYLISWSIYGLFIAIVLFTLVLALFFGKISKG
jgi:hypothetical protein